MKASPLLKFILPGAVLLACVGFIAQHVLKKPSPDVTNVEESGATRLGYEKSKHSPFDVIESDAEPASQTSKAQQTLPVSPGITAPDVDPNAEFPSWDKPLSEAQLGELVARLKDDPELLQRLIDEFRQELDPARKRQLALVLGEVGGEEVTLLASELIFSGDSAARTLGMDLLQQVQPGNEQAREIVSGMLATEVEPDVLIDAMTALSSPGEVDDDSRAYLSDQLALLTTHEDDGVRSISLNILSRWSEDGRYTDAILAGLDDDSEYVRSSAAYALVDHEESTPTVIDRLFITARDAREQESVRRAAILALRSMPLSTAQLAELDATELRLNTKPR